MQGSGRTDPNLNATSFPCRHRRSGTAKPTIHLLENPSEEKHCT